MNISYEHKPAMTLIGFSTSILPEEGYQKCPEFWDKEYAQKYARLWQTMRPETDIEKAMLEVYSPGDMQSPDYECGIWVPICKPEKDECEAAEIASMMITGIL
ncbi:MAG: hypothetical protein ACI3U1_08820 [Peptococcaceae bacterium]